MTSQQPQTEPARGPAVRPVTVLLVDDQAIVGEAVRRMLAAEQDVVLHHCSDPTKAIETANDISPTVILQDLVMPEIDGLTLVKFFRANAKTSEVPMIVLSTKEEPTTKAEAFARGANDYLVKLPDKIELIARIRYHSQAYRNLLERNEAYRKLAESQRQLTDEVAQAAKYVFSLLPEPLTGDVQAAWRYVPSTQLGGDSFGYHWLDPDHLAIYVLDVSGHGVGASLLSVSAMNVLSSRSLPGVDFRDPRQVLDRLNNTFQMDKHDNKYFTIWYGVFEKSSRVLSYAGGGHPASLLHSGPGAGPATWAKLESHGPGIGFWLDAEFISGQVQAPAGSRLYLFTDGVFEIARPDGTMWAFQDFMDFLASLPPEDPALLDGVLSHVRRLHGAESLEDDFCLLRITL